MAVAGMVEEGRGGRDRQPVVTVGIGGNPKTVEAGRIGQGRWFKSNDLERRHRPQLVR